ncbi:MAG: hypothetical protein ACFFA3_19385 [Promethearchaeota archaeon]
MELKAEGHHKPSNKVEIEKIIFWTIVFIGLICIYFLFFYDFIPKLFYLVPWFIYYSLYNPLFLLGILGIIVVSCYFGSLTVKSLKSLKFQKIDKNDETILNNAIRKKISHVLRANIGNAYTKDALLNRVVEKVRHPYFKKYLKSNGEKVLKELVSEGKISITQKDGKFHYFFSQT